MGLLSKKVINIVIMIEPGKLEWQGLMLIESIVEHCLDDYRVYVYCRAEKVSSLCSGTLAYLAKKNISISPIENDFKPEYPHGNKIIAVSKKRRAASFCVFLDTDTLLLKDFSFVKDIGRKKAVSVVAAGLSTWSKDEIQWELAYHSCGVEKYKKNITLRNGEVSPPYFNAGMVMFPEAGPFKEAWLACAQSIDSNDSVENKRPWLDQVALPIAIKKSGLIFNMVSPRYNMGLNNENNDVESAFVGHYHSPKWVYFHGINKKMRAYVQKSIGEKNFKEFKEKIEGGKFSGVSNSAVEDSVKVKLYGVFRSGTNYAKTVLEWNFNCTVFNDAVEWKHGYVPTKARASLNDYKVLVVSKNPLSSIWSLYKYICENGKNIKAEKEWDDFLRSPVVVFDEYRGGSPQYIFKNPAAFWESMYWNYMSIVGNDVYHVRYEDLLESPSEAFRVIKTEFGLKQLTPSIAVPVKKVKNMGDKEKATRYEYLRGYDFDPSEYKDKEYLKRYSQDQVEFVVNNIDSSLLERMGYKSFGSSLSEVT